MQRVTRVLDIWIRILIPACLMFDFVAYLCRKNVKIEFTLKQFMKVQSVIRGIALLFL